MKLHELLEATTKYKERTLLSVKGPHPDHLDDGFSCTFDGLTSLEGAPPSLSGSFDCTNNKLASLKHAPTKVGKHFYSSNNLLTSLEGAPSYIGGNFSCFKNKLTSLHNIHKQIKHIGGYGSFEGNPIKSHVLGLLLIDGLKECFLDNQKVQVIIDKHLNGDRDVFACQEELIENGLEDFAQL